MKRLIFVQPNGGVAVTIPAGRRDGEPEAAWLDRVARKCCPKGGKLVAVRSPEEMPDRKHRDAWVWDGQNVIVDPSRIKPPAPAVQQERAGTVVARDPRVDALGPQLSEQIASAFQAMHRDLVREVAVEHRRALESLTVASALAEGKQVEPGSFPALERSLLEQGRPVTSDEIIAAADEHTRRVIDLVAGEQ